MMKFTVVFLAIALCLATFAHADQTPRQNVGLENCQCPTTLELLPVCGSNGVIYSSKGMLNCAKTCLKLGDLKIVSHEHCHQD